MAWSSLKALKSDMGEIMLDTDIDDRYIIRGSMPPPPRQDFDIDAEEMRLRFGDHGDQLGNENNMKPDLDGIKEFIKMLEPEERFDWREESRILLSKKIISQNNNLTQTEKSQYAPDNSMQNESPIKKTAISDLNPNVPCFIPTVLKEPCSLESVNSDERKKTENVKNDTTLIEVPANKIIDEAVLGTSNTNVEHESKISKKNPCGDNEIMKTSLTPATSKSEETLDTNTVELLKKKIIDASKASRKREKNVAMAALLRLKTSPDMLSPNSTPRKNSPITTSSENTETAVKTEDVFQIPTDIVFNNIIECGSNTSSQKNLVLFTPEYFERVTTSRKTPVTVEPAVVEPLVESQVSEIEIEEKQIEESIKKVEDWLEPQSPKPEKKQKTLILKPVMFKRKCAASASPVSQTSEIKHVKPDPVPSYVPSAYATELLKKYEENAKTKQVPDAPVDIFTKLEAELKVRDEKIRRQKEQQSLDSSYSQDADESISTVSASGLSEM